MPTASDNLYEILQISPTAEPEIVRAAYKRLIQKYHPDKVLDGNLEADDCVKKISYAYSILKDPGRRATYDAKQGYSKPKETTAKAEQPFGGASPKSQAEPGQSKPESAAPSSSSTGSSAKPSVAKTKKVPSPQSGWIVNKIGDEKLKVKKTLIKDWVKPVESAPIIDGWEADKIATRQGVTAKFLSLPRFFRARLMIGIEGPVMTVLPSGSFTMGSPSGIFGIGGEKERHANEGPCHSVTIASPFAIGRFAVSFNEYDFFCRATDRPLPDDGGLGRGNLPVVNVNWADATAYCEWLARQTGKLYRLPSEAEWEYACRAGTVTPFWWGQDISPHRANYNGHHIYNRGNRGRNLGHTLPVGEHGANPFGLFQVSGNVWEWCQDTWHKDYKKAPGDGSPWVEGADVAGDRVVRGGSYASEPGWLRSAFRSHCPAEGRYDDQGFRIALTLPPIQTEVEK